MNFLDFLCDSPKLFIFDKEANKTNFGGVLFLIYIIIMVLISIMYIISYSKNDKYNFEGFTFQNHTKGELTQKDLKQYDEDDELNPYLTLTITFLSDEFSIYDFKDKKYLDEKYIEREIDGNTSVYKIRHKVNDFDFDIYYQCGVDPNCSSFKGYFFYGEINFEYPEYKINHFGKIPVQMTKNNSIIYHNNLLFSDNIGIEYMTFEWETIKYKDQKSMLDLFTDRKKEYTFGHVKYGEPVKKFFSLDNYKIEDIGERGYLLLMSKISIKNNYQEYLYYKREKVEVLDVIANIGALFPTLKFFFLLVFSFYSKNFDNYKIIAKILSSPKKQIQVIELSKTFTKSLTMKNDIPKNDLNNSLINEISNNNKLISEDSFKYIKENNNVDDSSFTLKKLSFYDFFFNNIYCKCCKKIKNQEIINNVNNIIYKYLSIDSLLYNQIKLENLFIDYKWNNPLLNKIGNNYLIIKLKES